MTSKPLSTPKVNKRQRPGVENHTYFLSRLRSRQLEQGSSCVSCCPTQTLRWGSVEKISQGLPVRLFKKMLEAKLEPWETELF